MSPIALTVLAACVSGLVTALVILFVVRLVIDRRLAAAGEEIAAKVRRAVEEGADAVAPKVRDATQAHVPQILRYLRSHAGDGHELGKRILFRGIQRWRHGN